MLCRQAYQLPGCGTMGLGWMKRAERGVVQTRAIDHQPYAGVQLAGEGVAGQRVARSRAHRAPGMVSFASRSGRRRCGSQCFHNDLLGFVQP